MVYDNHVNPLFGDTYFSVSDNGSFKAISFAECFYNVTASMFGTFFLHKAFVEFWIEGACGCNFFNAKVGKFFVPIFLTEAEACKPDQYADQQGQRRQEALSGRTVGRKSHDASPQVGGVRRRRAGRSLTIRSGRRNASVPRTGS